MSYTSGTKKSKRTNNEEIWACSSCNGEWKGKDDDGNRWIVCNMCDKQYHLQCSGITYDEEDFYKTDIENELFICGECEWISKTPSKTMFKVYNNRIMTQNVNNKNTRMASSSVFLLLTLNRHIFALP